MKKLAARDFKDLLQCAGPCFEGLFGRYDAKIQDLLFITACWHASAKLRLHTDSSLNAFRGMTASFTQELRFFAKKVCPSFVTRKTPKEAQKAQRRRAAEAAKDAGHGSARSVNLVDSEVVEFNLHTPKIHSIIHYPDCIAAFGTTDSYSTQLVSFII
jgi:hypothetical protein